MKLKELQAVKIEMARMARAIKEAEPHMAGNITGTKETGTLRRASMDLTRALARLRRS